MKKQSSAKNTTNKTMITVYRRYSHTAVIYDSNLGLYKKQLCTWWLER